MPSPLTAPALLREVGLMPDGPVPWGRPVPSRRAGVFVVELPAPLATAPIELTRVGKWLEHVPTLTMDGERPTSRALSARLASFWLPDQVVLYVGSSEGSIGGRLGAMQKTALGDRRPASGGHWLGVLTALPKTRVWWAEADAVEEYEDALLAAFGAAAGAGGANQSDAGVVLPFANLRRPTGERRVTGISGSLLREPAESPASATHVVVVPDGDAEGARGEPQSPRVPTVAVRTTSRAGPAKTRATGAAAGAAASAGPSATLTADGARRLQAELTELTDVKRPQVIGRIRSAKELGDLKENADYHAAREEQSFLEGRIQALEAQLRGAVIATVPTAGAGADLGSTITVEVDGDSLTYTLVGSAEADPSSGRLSVLSPVGRALVGAVAGTEVVVQTPRGPVRYLVTRVE